MHVVGRRLRLSFATLASPSARFAARVAARHAGAHSSSVPWLSRVLQRMRRAVVARGAAHLTFAPHIHVRLASFARHAGDAPFVARHAMNVVPRVVQRTVSAPSAEAMLQRSEARVVRSDGGARGTRPTLAGVAAAVADTLTLRPSATQVARVLRRRAPAVIDDVSLVSRDERSVRMAMQPPRPQQLSPIEVARLTDHIVHTIDRRIAAFRERQGRV